ncbi:MAG: anthranilate synthase component I [Candidatus Sumerlaeia bacterium]
MPEDSTYNFIPAASILIPSGPERIMIRPTREEFLELARTGNLIPVYREVLADMETPVSAFRKLDEGSEFSFLLESVEQGEWLGRYSFLGADPKVLLKGKGDEVELYLDGDYRSSRRSFGTPLEALRRLMRRYRPVPDPHLPPFLGGAVGYISYDAVRYFERIPEKNPDDLLIPDVFFMITDSIVIFDHIHHKMLIVANAHVERDAGKAYDEAVHKIALISEKLKSLMADRLQGRDEDDDDNPKRAPRPGTSAEIGSNFTRDEFEAVVRRCKEYIYAGDAFQIVVSQRLHREMNCNPFDIYRALRAVNPSPYMFYLKFRDLQLIGSSPEILVRLEGDRVTLRPIAGTRPRGTGREEDLALERDLLSDHKERAEHIMLVDLGRNDVGRVCRFGTVRVSDLMTIERYSHVMHIVSNVEGRLKPGLDAFDVLAAAFPAGTLTGAPKVRAMEIIDELENVRRGPYGGCVGYFSFDGNFDSCITIRTVVVKDRVAYVQAGAGVVADSDPGREYEETLNKARGMLKAIEMAEAGLD